MCVGGGRLGWQWTVMVALTRRADTCRPSLPPFCMHLLPAFPGRPGCLPCHPTPHPAQGAHPPHQKTPGRAPFALLPQWPSPEGLPGGQPALDVGQLPWGGGRGRRLGAAQLHPGRRGGCGWGGVNWVCFVLGRRGKEGGNDAWLHSLVIAHHIKQQRPGLAPLLWCGPAHKASSPPHRACHCPAPTVPLPSSPLSGSPLLALYSVSMCTTPQVRLLITPPPLSLSLPPVPPLPSSPTFRWAWARRRSPLQCWPGCASTGG